MSGEVLRDSACQCPPMPDIDTKELRRLMEEATAGKWQPAISSVRRSLCIVTDDAWICGELSNGNGERPGEGQANCDLIVAMHNALPALLSEAEEAARLREENERLSKIIRGCQWYWPADDTSGESCHDGPWDAVDYAGVGDGDVIAVARGGIVEVTYCGRLPPAHDSDRDDDFWVEEATEAEALRKIAAELDRREGITTGGDDARD